MSTKRYVFACLILMALIGLIGRVGAAEHTYTRKNCTVISVEGTTVQVQDDAGYLWTFEGTGYALDTHVNLHMHTNYTHGTVYDDYILDVD